jgi:hypothetical protein
MKEQGGEFLFFLLIGEFRSGDSVQPRNRNVLEMIELQSQPTSPSLLEFAHGQKVQDPHDGLSVFGPYDIGRPSKPKSINRGLVATSAGREKILNWIRQFQNPIYPGKNRRGVDLDPRLRPLFPGFDAAFDCSFSPQPTWYKELDEKRLVELCSNLDSKKRAFDAVEEYLTAIRLTEKKDEAFDVILCVLSDFGFPGGNTGSPSPAPVYGVVPKVVIG